MPHNRRSRSSYSYLISCRLGDAMAAHIVMVWAASYAANAAGRRLSKVRMIQANQWQCNIADLATRLDRLYDRIDQGRGGKWDHFEQEQPEMYGLACVVDHTRNSAFRKVLADRRFDPDLVQVVNNDRLDDWSPKLLDTLPGRAFLINDLSSEMAERRVSLEPKGNIPVSDIAEALEGAQRRSTAREMDTTLVVETDYRDDLALCTALGVFWSHYRPAASENWQLFAADYGRTLVPYGGAVI